MTRKQALAVALKALERQEEIVRLSPVLMLNDPQDLDNPELSPHRIVNLKDTGQVIEEIQQALQVLNRCYKAER